MDSIWVTRDDNANTSVRVCQWKAAPRYTGHCWLGNDAGELIVEMYGTLALRLARALGIQPGQCIEFRRLLGEEFDVSNDVKGDEKDDCR